MEITKADLEARIEELQKLREARLADANAIGGAIQDCEFWARRLDLAASDGEPVQPPRLLKKDGDVASGG